MVGESCLNPWLWNQSLSRTDGGGRWVLDGSMMRYDATMRTPHLSTSSRKLPTLTRMADIVVETILVEMGAMRLSD